MIKCLIEKNYNPMLNIYIYYDTGIVNSHENKVDFVCVEQYPVHVVTIERLQTLLSLNDTDRKAGSIPD